MKGIVKYLFNVRIPHVIKSFSSPENQILRLFAIEGILNTLINNLVGSNNNMFATRLGANDLELSLVNLLPQLVGMIVLIPGGLLTDVMKSKRDMVTRALLVVAFIYMIIGFVPAFGSHKLELFLILLALSSAPMTIYNASWQAYFSDVVHPNARNNTLAVRTAMAFLIGVIASLLSGALLAAATTNSDKIRLHQIFLWIAAILLILQVIVLKRIPSNTVNNAKKINLTDIKSALATLIRSRKFWGFVGVAIFFYLTWHIDWTLYFIGETQYLGMNEAWLSYIKIGEAVIQFLTMGIWSKINSKQGVRFSIIFGSLGLSLCPIGMIFSTSLHTENAKLIFLILHILFNITLATTNLNIIQCLLQVIPDTNKTFNISVYTALVMISNGVMPVVGVKMYQILGGDLQALQKAFWIIFVLRVIATGLWAIRWWVLRKEEM